MGGSDLFVLKRSFEKLPCKEDLGREKVKTWVGEGLSSRCEERWNQAVELEKKRHTRTVETGDAGTGGCGLHCGIPFLLNTEGCQDEAPESGCGGERTKSSRDAIYGSTLEFMPSGCSAAPALSFLPSESAAKHAWL